MIDDLDKTLEHLLRRELPPDLAKVSITFATPDNEFPGSADLPAIDMFLYDLRENRDLRSNEWTLDRRSDGTGTRTRAPVRVECSYLVTAWPKDIMKPAEDEHRLLSATMRVLLRFPTLPADVLQGALRHQVPSLPTSSLQPGRLQSLAEFWQAITKPKAALNYTVTLAIDVYEPEEVRLVTDKTLNHYEGMEVGH